MSPTVVPSRPTTRLQQPLKEIMGERWRIRLSAGPLRRQLWMPLPAGLNGICNEAPAQATPAMVVVAQGTLVAGKPPEESPLRLLLAGKGIPKNDSDAVEMGYWADLLAIRDRSTWPLISSMRFHTVQTVLAYAMCQLAGYFYNPSVSQDAEGTVTGPE